VKPLRVVFGARAQVIVGAIVLLGALAQWVYGTTLHGDALIRLLFHVSMEALVYGAYSIVATGLGYRATERVETAVIENIEKADTVVKK
jgi:hypothetical protein